MKGDMSIKERQDNKKKQLINKVKRSELYKEVLNKFSDASLVDVISDKKKDC